MRLKWPRFCLKKVDDIPGMKTRVCSRNTYGYKLLTRILSSLTCCKIVVFYDRFSVSDLHHLHKIVTAGENENSNEEMMVLSS